MVEKQLQTNMFLVCLRMVTTCSEDFIEIRSWLQIVGAATENARLPILSLVLGKQLFWNGLSTGPGDMRLS